MKIVKKVLKILVSFGMIAATAFTSGYAYARGSHIGKQVNEMGPDSYADKFGSWIGHVMTKSMERYVGLLRDKGSKGRGKSEPVRPDRSDKSTTRPGREGYPGGF